MPAAASAVSSAFVSQLDVDEMLITLAGSSAVESLASRSVKLEAGSESNVRTIRDHRHRAQSVRTRRSLSYRCMEETQLVKLGPDLVENIDVVHPQ